MSQNRAVKGVALLFGIGVGVGITVFTLGGGGYSSGGYDKPNDDPRSVLVESVLVEYGDGSAPAWMSEVGGGSRVELGDHEFGTIVQGAALGGDSEGVVVRSPSALIQHEERGTISIVTPSGSFEVTLAPTVLKDDVIRLGIDASWSGEHAGGDGHGVSFSTVFTSDGTGLVLDLSGVSGTSERGGGLLVAVRPTLVDPSED